jgi:hypothetical protein
MSLLSLSPSPPQAEERECSVGMVCTLLKQDVNEIARNGGMGACRLLSRKKGADLGGAVSLPQCRMQRAKCGMVSQRRLTSAATIASDYETAVRRTAVASVAR